MKCVSVRTQQHSGLQARHPSFRSKVCRPFFFKRGVFRGVNFLNFHSGFFFNNKALMALVTWFLLPKRLFSHKFHGFVRRTAIPPVWGMLYFSRRQISRQKSNCGSRQRHMPRFNGSNNVFKRMHYSGMTFAYMYIGLILHTYNVCIYMEI